MSSETCSLSLGGMTNDSSRFGSILEGPLGKFFCTREKLNGLANVEAVLCAKVRRWQRQQEWWEARNAEKEELNAGWFFGPVRHFQRLSHLSHAGLEVRAHWGIHEDSNFNDEGFYLFEPDFMEATTDSHEPGHDQAYCTSEMALSGKESLVLDCAVRCYEYSDDDQRSSQYLPLSWQKRNAGGGLEVGNPRVVTSGEQLICTLAREADLSSVMEASSTSFGGGQDDGYTNWPLSPQSGSKAVTSRPAGFSCPLSLLLADKPDLCSLSSTDNRDEVQPDTPTGCETQTPCTSRKRARRKTVIGGLPLQTQSEELVFKVVSRRKRQGRRPKSKGSVAIPWGAAGDITMCVGSSQRDLGSTVSVKRITLDRVDVDSKKLSGLEGMVVEKVHDGLDLQSNYFKASKECSKTEVNFQPTAAQSQLDISNQALYMLEDKVSTKLPTVLGPSTDRRMKTRTMIRALQVQRGGTKAVSICLKRKRDSLKTCVLGGKSASSFGGPYMNSAAPKTCALPARTSQVECFYCKGSLSSGQVVCCNYENCWRVYHLSCTQCDEGFSWRRNDKLVCPHHVCIVCRKVRASILWRCEKCPVAFHQHCCPSSQHTMFSSYRPGFAVCWRHSAHWKLQNKHKQPTSDIKEVFNRLPLPDQVENFQITSCFWKEVMENDKEPPPYTLVRRNVFLIKKKRDDFDDGVSCSCQLDDSQVCGEDCECRVQSMSCSKSCNCYDKCTNKPFRKERRVKVVKTEHCGWGAEASEAIERGEFIIEYTGEVIDDATCEKRLWAMKGRSVHNFYMCEIAKDFIIDATFKGNPSRYLNHSCQPNCKLEKWRVDGETRVGVFALTNIEVGEPLTYNYKFIDYGMKVICRCGAANCRGAIGEKSGNNRIKSKGNGDRITAWGVRKKRSYLQNRLQDHIRYVVRNRNYRKPARAS